jgi:hypothetical protein
MSTHPWVIKNMKTKTPIIIHLTTKKKPSSRLKRSRKGIFIHFQRMLKKVNMTEPFVNFSLENIIIL